MSEPLHFDDNTKISTNQKTLIWLLATTITLTFSGVWAWGSVKATAQDADTKATKALVAVAADHDVIVKNSTQIDVLIRKVDKIDDKIDKILDRAAVQFRITGSGGGGADSP